MSKAKKLSDLPLVTSLGSSDTIIATDPNGSAKRIAFNNAEGTQKTYALPSNAGSGIWMRICRIFSEACGHIFINTRYGNTQPQPTEFAYFGSHASTINDAKAYSFNPNATFPKIRVVYKTGVSDMYLEIFVKYLTQSDWIYAKVVGIGMTPMPSYTPGSIPEGYTSKEFDLTKTAWGG